MSGSVRSERGWKHMTRQVPAAGWKRNSSSPPAVSAASAASGSSAGKSLSNTKVDV